LRPVALRDFRVPTHRLAGMLWGEVNATYRCNRRGASYYSCSGHGGYVVDSRALTARERRKIDKYKLPLPLNLLVQHRNGGGDVVVGVDAAMFANRYRPRRMFHYSPGLGPVEWQELPVYVFEEDCDWAILEHLTEVHDNDRRGRIISEHRRKSVARDTFRRWARPVGERQQ